ncbi:hypothetical protein A3D80_02335 [Candidatus Roizmanbacteria bacterium RIFCSPHIGHO2_02_FULL_40_13b]|uniref:Uncharacterized protein n=1 Tax=Candidatus Roizmanbacteria bacterium RIFCSPHIGHO2_01_FULL_39_24 TaxID=1802032 RepID=A0A1F7GHJ0_9BACT|nr:MAG: hypothetical protein A2799_03545 [Candidatus Roizmanbacteria bacterium RIFCSPHIGHO2_01_FULL_39_24]OGK27659.1 MAG: hypothetical protein A3D80_02335 [Candidatus Roizmanbacteria bacterium RIFCSPHIGHO2_02_FULL_40_13b]OGK57084.1 MAG: hypothetical protein A3H83_02935 [Candidatus Roizmanbacteria bacterium RIFCSPLOWO2_02_FULL_39_8]
MTTQTFLGALATIIAFVSFIPYYKDIFDNKTKPHAFSWFVWSLITGTSFLGQLSVNAGPGAWVMGFVSLGCFSVFLLSLVKGEKNIVLLDWISLTGALISLLFWIITKTPVYSAILITLTDALAFVPTLRKSISKPYEETTLTYFLGGIQFLISLFALNSITIVTALYPAFLVIVNFGFSIVLFTRRRQLGAV